MFWKSMDLFEKELMSIFNCDPDWPICLFDFTFKNKLPTYLCFKVKNDMNKYIIDNYFDEKN